MSVNAIMAQLCDELAEGGVPAPHHQDYALTSVWYDLCRLIGEEPPVEVRLAVEGATVELVAD